MREHDYYSEAYEILGTLTALDTGAYLETIGGGAIGVTVDLSATHKDLGELQVLFTPDYGAGLYQTINGISEPLEDKAYYFTFDDDGELTEPLWKQTTKALEWLRNELNGMRK